VITLKQLVLGTVAATAVALAPIAPAMANGHGFGGVRPFGFGHGLVGAAVALATLPLVIASAVVSGGEVAGPGYAAPPAYYAPRPGYYPAARGYYAPRAGYYGGYPARGGYYSGRYGHPHR
jgi:hypothetical protein